MYTFRIKGQSNLEKYLDILMSEYPDGVTQADLKKDYPEVSWNTLGALTELGASADNFVFSRNTISYVDVVPQTVIHQATEVVADTVAAPVQTELHEVERIKWPSTPIINGVEDFPWFRKPSWYDRMALMVKAGKHISLAGPPGIGKSSAVEYMAAEQGKVLVNVSADAGLRRRDLTGNTELVNSHTQFQVAEYTTAAINGWWCKIDEVNAAEPDALMFLNSQIAPPLSVNFYGQSMPVHPGFRLFVTYNPGLVGTKPLPESLKDRFFPVKLEFPTKSQLRRMLEANGMPEGAVDGSWTEIIVQFGMRVWDSHQMGRMRYQITPRRLMDAVTLLTLDGCDVWDALEAAVVMAVDNIAESRVLKDILQQLKQLHQFGRA